MELVKSDSFIKTEVRSIVDSIKKETMSIDTFLSLPPVLWQRFTEGRAKTNKVKKSLKNLRPEHLEVAIAELTQDCEFYGQIYKKGYRAILNGNTRQYFWKNGLSNYVPDFVYATVYYFDDMNEMRESYDTFDSLDAVEMKKEKLYGLLCRVHNFTPESTKLQKGEILSALNMSCVFYDPTIFNQPSVKPIELKTQVDIYIEEIKAFDKICTKPKNWDQALVCGALVSFKIFGTKNPRLLECLFILNEHTQNTTPKERDGATHIVNEWDVDKVFPVKTTGFETLKQTSAFVIYWIMQYVNDVKLSQIGYNWKETPRNLFNEYHKKNAIIKNRNLNRFVKI